MKQGAFSIANPFSLSQATQLLDFAPLCTQSRCRLWHDQIEHDVNARVHVASGFTVQIRAQDPDPNITVQFVDQFLIIAADRCTRGATKRC